MATYLMSGKYSLEALKEISAQRTATAVAVIRQHGGEIKAAYAPLGDTDLLLIVDLPDTERAIQTSVALTNLLAISFSTVPAITVEEFDKLMA